MINFYLTYNDPVHDRVIWAMHDGYNGDKKICDVKDYEPSEIAVVFGVEKGAVEFSKHRGNIMRWQKERGGRTLVLETGYIKRGDDEDSYYAAGFDGLNGNADFRNRNMPSDRFEELGIELKPWREDGEYILLCGQVPWDASVQHTDHVGWLSSAVEGIRKNTGKPVIFRPHPKGPDFNLPHTTKSTGTLESELEGAFAHVSFNSNSGVDAVLAGVPTFTGSRDAMADEVSNRNFLYLGNPMMPDRKQWANNIAYTQWTLEEMAEGKAWAHLLR
jgi:hypothetical protein